MMWWPCSKSVRSTAMFSSIGSHVLTRAHTTAQWRQRFSALMYGTFGGWCRDEWRRRRYGGIECVAPANDWYYVRSTRSPK
eukprot:6194363-Pleurochrysis_carterae.AAC.1